MLHLKIVIGLSLLLSVASMGLAVVNYNDMRSLQELAVYRVPHAEGEHRHGRFAHFSAYDRS